MKKNKVIAILTADWHLSHKPPVWRSNEPDWYAAMARPLDEISYLRHKHQCIVLCAGDIFDKWNSPAELINFAIDHLPVMLYTVPGQHDIPNHNMTEIKKSAYATLHLSKTVYDLVEYVVHPFNECTVHAFPFGVKIDKLEEAITESPQIALVHDYVWTGKHKYPKAPKEARVETRSSKLINGKLYGYDVIVYGDNHKGFLTKVGKTTIFNCGTLMRRKSDEVDYKPQVGLLYSDGTVEPHYLDISKDKHLTAEEVKDIEVAEELDMTQFAKELQKLGASALDFTDAIKRFCRTDKTRKAVRNIILKAMEK